MGKKTSHSSAEAKGGKPQASGKPGSPIGETALLKVLYTNADVLTGAKMMELKTLVDQTQPKIIGVVEVNQKNSGEPLPPRNTVSLIITLNFRVLAPRTVEGG